MRFHAGAIDIDVQSTRPVPELHGFAQKPTMRCRRANMPSSIRDRDMEIVDVKRLVCGGSAAVQGGRRGLDAMS